MESVHRKLPPNPKNSANLVSIFLFYWTGKIFREGYTKELNVEDIFEPLEEDRSESLGDRLEKQWLKQQATSKNPSLLKATVITFWKELLYMGILSVLSDFGVRLAQPIVLGQLLNYFRLGTNKDENATNEAYLYGAGLIGLVAAGALIMNHFAITAYHNGMKVRVAICSVIYRKSLRLSRTAIGDTAPGKIVNLLSNDVSRFDLVSILIHSMWSAPLLAIIVAILLYREVQWAGLVGMCVVFLVVPIQSYTGKLSSIFRLQTAIRTDERVRFMDEIISGVQVIKMYAWEIPFAKLIQLCRQLELKIVLKNSYVRALYMTCNLFTTRAALFCTMMVLALTSQEITAAKIFVTAAYFNAVSWTMSQMFVRGVAEVAESLVAFKRLQTFLEYEERDIVQQKDPKEKILKEFGMNGDIKEKDDTNIPSNVSVQLKNATAKWTAPAPVKDSSDKKKKKKSKKSAENDIVNNIPNTLDNISIDFKKGYLIGVIGAVGAGKSSLLQLILKELPLTSGTLNIKGKLSYACQEPWVFSASVRQNILFGEHLERNRYESVVKSCALNKDFEQFSNGDKTIIGEKGSSLSGGQKARISLARAIYREADIYLLDDPISAVDAHVGLHLFNEVIGPTGRLARRNATRILVTHQIHFLKEADWLVVLDDGKVKMQGKPSELARSGIDIAQYLEIQGNEEDNQDDEPRTRRRSISRLSSRNSSINESDDGEEEKEEALDQNFGLESTSKGTVKGSVPLNYFKAGGPLILAVIIAILFVITQICGSFADYWVSFWTAQEELRSFYEKQNGTEIFEDIHSNLTNSSSHALDPVVVEENLSNFLSTENCMIIHGIIIVSIFVIGITRAMGFYGMAMTASQKLHDAMFTGIISAPMRFFDTNPSGRILNRFSKDMGSVDELLPKALLDSTQIILGLLGAVILTCSIRPIFLVPLSGLTVIFMFIRRIYLKTSKNIKRMEGITKSPVYTHISASLGGLSTIRAFGAQPLLIKEFDSHQDLHSGSWFMFISTAIAFGFSLDLICLIFVTCITFYFLIFDSNSMGDGIGLALTQIISLAGLLQWGIRQSAEVPNQFMSVERILEYRDLEPEKQPQKPVETAKNWPADGKIEFKNVFYTYYEGADPVLKGLSFIVSPGEKIGIVGRTGAGKSSLIGALFRLANIKGDIIIDNVNTASITLQKLRSKISIIPQDPVLFSGTIRRNLDQFEEFPDSELWKALEAVELKDIASGPYGLQGPVAAGGSNFSVGERQLICLARAILRNNKVLVLDEATANVDPHTDGLIQRTIREKFNDCTVLTIAHRLHTIMDSDRVLVMNTGIVQEFDTPYKLLQNKSGIFRDMVQATGPQEAERLSHLAEEKHNSITKKS